MIDRPISVYINWAAYDELSDNVELTETLAQRQLDELLRLRAAGVCFDYYLMDAFWYAKDGAYRTWRKPHWPNGPDAWLDRCLNNGVKPGLWVAGNSTHSHDPIPAWRDSLTADGGSLCLFSGGFLNHFLESLHLWYQRGVRMFKFDFMNLDAATPDLTRCMLPSEIRAQNVAALIADLKAFRQQHPEVVLLAYNGFEERPHFIGGVYATQNSTSLPFRKTVDTKWLEVFDSLYCGDPRPADVPAMNFWRAKDIYSDHMVRVYELNGIPLPRIDNTAFMIGTTGTCYFRKTAAWQGMLLLSLARGGWVNTYYGNLDLLTDEQARWFAKVQQLYLGLQAYGQTRTFGAMPGAAEPYGFSTQDPQGALYTLVNPSQRVATVTLDGLGGHAGARVLFSDVGFVPQIAGAHVTLGPEQLALIGTGKYASLEYDLGVQADVIIPRSAEPLAAAFISDGDRAIATTLYPPASGHIRVIMRQRDPPAGARRTSGGAPPNGLSLGQMLTITVEQDGRTIPVDINYDKAIWSGLSWAVAEVPVQRLTPGQPVRIRCRTWELLPLTLTGELYHVQYE
ncbi:MAG: hypothetical protein M1546_11570 [Chloroflexi bacterium]|nr:hypothetical protein [Chloroflexota bacterium]